MKLIMMTKNEMLNAAVKVINSGSYPFVAFIQDESLIISFRWKDAISFETGVTMKEMQSFRYVVILNDDGTFYGYDTDDMTLAKTGINGRAFLRTSSFIGHEIRFSKEIAIGKNRNENNIGIRQWKLSVKKLHDDVCKIFETHGWEYQEPSVAWVYVKGSNKLVYKMLSLIFFSVMILTSLLFFLVSITPMLIFMILFGILGIWSLLAGFGKVRLPVFSVKAAIKIIIGGIILSVTATLFAILTFMGFKGLSSR